MAKASITFTDVEANEEGRNIEVTFETDDMNDNIDDGIDPTKAQRAAYVFFELISDLIVQNIEDAEKAE